MGVPAMRREVTGCCGYFKHLCGSLLSWQLSGHPPVAAFCVGWGGGCLHDQIRSESFGLQPDETLIIQTHSGL